MASSTSVTSSTISTSSTNAYCHAVRTSQCIEVQLQAPALVSDLQPQDENLVSVIGLGVVHVARVNGASE